MKYFIYLTAGFEKPAVQYLEYFIYEVFHILTCGF